MLGTDAMQGNDRFEGDDRHSPEHLAAFYQYRNVLFSIAYRMLGSVADAEDMLQETFLRWQQVGESEIRSPRAFLVTILSRLCVNHLQSARVRREEYVGPWLPEPLVIEPGSDPSEALRIDESISLAFLVLLERLTPLERAVFLLREVFEYDYAEIAEVLEQTEANCRQILHRARQHVAEGRPRFKSAPKQQDELFRRFVQAVGDGNMDGLLRILARDAVLHADGGGKGPALPNPVHGGEHVARAILGGMKRLPRNLTRRFLRINGQSGVISYLDGQPFSAFTVEIADGVITTVFVISNPGKLAHLPPAPC